MNTASGPPGSKMVEGQCPPLYAEGLFVRAFGEAYFVKHFEWLLRRDPEFGQDSYGQTTRLYTERCFVMHGDLNKLVENDGWKSKSEFKAYIEAVEKVSDLGEKMLTEPSLSLLPLVSLVSTAACM